MAIEDIIRENTAHAAAKEAERLLAKKAADDKAAEEAAAAKIASDAAAAKLAADEVAKAVADKATADAAAAKLAADEVAKAAKAKGEPVVEPVEEDEEPVADAKGMISLPSKQFAKRLARATKAALKEAFGTDDLAAIKKMRLDHESLLSKQDEERRSKLDEVTRANEDRDKALERARLAEEREATRAEDADAEREERVCNGIAAEYLDKDAFELAHFKFAKHLKRKSAEELENYTEEQINAWYKNFAEKHPKYAKVDAAAAKAAADKATQDAADKAAADKVAADKAAADKLAGRRVVVVPANVGAAGKKPDSKLADPNVGKTPSPGHANSMTNAEWAKYKRDHKISY